MKDMFYYSGTLTKGIFYDGKCVDCPFRQNNICPEREVSVEWYVKHGEINEKCPYITK